MVEGAILERAIIDWAIAARAAIAVSEPAVLISILATEGSAPRGAGTRMLVTARELAGTIGGGALEYQAVAQARAMLDRPSGCWRVQDYPLGPLLGQCCGGRVRLLIERLDSDAGDWIGRDGVWRTHFDAEGLRRERLDDRVAASPLSARGDRPGAGDSIVEATGEPAMPVRLFGAGHVGRAIVRAADGLPIRFGWFDTRPETADEPGVMWIADAQIESCVAAACSDTVILILTHDHGLDYRLTYAALRSSACFVGLIGSATKRARFLARLTRDGIDAAARDRLVCPIGMAGITGKRPAEIAIAVLAQLLTLRKGTPPA